jgi:hypothetical protein
VRRGGDRVHVGGSVRTVTPAPVDDLPIFDEAPLREVEFAPRALRPPGRRGPVVAGAWALAVASLVTIGLLTRDLPDDRSPLIAEATGPGPARPLSSLPSTRMGALLLVPDTVALDAPAPARVEVTTPKVDVLGSMLVRAARVEIALEARGNRILDRVSIDVSNRDGGIRPERGPSFQASFDLPFPRPNGTMWVVVTAYDDRGMPLGATRRPFTVGPLLDPEVSLADSNPMGERWRPLLPGGPLLAAPPPMCLPLSPTLASIC